MARLTKELREMLCNLCRCTPHNKAFVDSILRLDEEVASEDGQCTGHEATIGRLSEDLRAARAARADLFSALSRVEASRDEARTMLGQLQSAFSAAVNVVIKTGHHRTTPVLAEAVSLIVAERDEARAVRANQETTIVDLGEALASAIDERDEAMSKIADVDRLLAIEEQAKRVVRAEKWYEWACLAHLDAHLCARTRTEDLRDVLIALNEASDALDAECHKLADMVGEGDET